MVPTCWSAVCASAHQRAAAVGGHPGRGRRRRPVVAVFRRGVAGGRAPIAGGARPGQGQAWPGGLHLLSLPRLVAICVLLAALPAAVVLPPLVGLAGLVLIMAVLIVVETTRYAQIRRNLRGA